LNEAVDCFRLQLASNQLSKHLIVNNVGRTDFRRPVEDCFMLFVDRVVGDYRRIGLKANVIGQIFSEKLSSKGELPLIISIHIDFISGPVTRFEDTCVSRLQVQEGELLPTGQISVIVSHRSGSYFEVLGCVYFGDIY